MTVGFLAPGESGTLEHAGLWFLAGAWAGQSVGKPEASRGSLDPPCVLRASAPAQLQDGVLSGKERMRIQKGAGVRGTQEGSVPAWELRTNLESQTVDSEQPQ